MLGSLSQICCDPVVPSGEQLHSNVFWPFLSFCSFTETKLPFQVYLTHKGVLYPCPTEFSGRQALKHRQMWGAVYGVEHGAAQRLCSSVTVWVLSVTVCCAWARWALLCAD